MLEIALISSRFAPETSPGAKRATDLVSALQGSGHRVTVLTQMPNYPDPAAYEDVLPANTDLRVERDSAGCATWRFRPDFTAKRALLRRLIAEKRFGRRVARRSTKLADLDGVVASTPFVFNLPAAHSYGAPTWLDVRDLTWEYVGGLTPRSPLKAVGARALRALALANLRRATRVSTTTDSQRQYLIERGLPATKVVVVPNGVPQNVADELGRRGVDNSDGNEGPIRVVYAGLLGFAQGLRFAVDSIADMPDEGIEFHLFGDGVDRQELIDVRTSRRLDHVHIHGHVTYDEYLDKIAAADILFASLRPNVKSAMPSKIWEYMAAGKPVLFAGTGEAPETIARTAAGMSIPYGETGLFQDALRELAKDARLRRQLGANGRTWVLRHRVREEINREWVDQIEAAFASTTPRIRPSLRDATVVETGRNGDSSALAEAIPYRRRALYRTATIAGRTAESTGFLRLLELALTRRSHRLPVLTYHRVIPDDAQPAPCPGLVSATPAAFAEQIAFLAARYNVVSIIAVLEAFRSGKPLPARALLLTFDDAYEDFAEYAWPTLRQHGLPVTLFVPTAFPGEPDRRFWWDRLYQVILATSSPTCTTIFGECPLRTPAERLRAFRRVRDGVKTLPHQDAMAVVDKVCGELASEPNTDRRSPAVLSWDDLRRLVREGVSLGAHTRTHPFLDQISEREIRTEVTGSLADLERETGIALPILAYPAGQHDDKTTRVLTEIGVQLAFTTHGRVNDLGGGVDPLRLDRIHVGRRMTRSLVRTRLLGFKWPSNRLRPSPDRA